MKSWRQIIIAMVCLALTATAACSSTGNGKNGARYEVSRGDIQVLVNGTGNIATGQETKLSFASGGMIESIAVTEGQVVDTGDVLARLRTDILELAETQARVDLAEAEAALSEARIARTTAEIAARTAELELKTIRDSEGQLEAALLDAQVQLEQAQRTLSTSINAVDYEAAEAQLKKAESWYDYILDKSQGSDIEVDDWDLLLERAEDSLNAARTYYNNVLTGYDSQEINIKKKQVASAEIAVAQAQTSLEDLSARIEVKEKEVSIAGETVNRAQLSEVYAETALKLAQQALDNASRELSEATIIAPFRGIIAAVHADAGDAVTAFSPVIHLVNPEQLELIVEIDEMDIPSVAAGQPASVGVDALPGISYSGSVAAVYPVPTKDTGLVMYNVKIFLDETGDSGIKVGMRASADIVVDERNGVIKVPNQAILEDEQGGYYVTVLEGNKPQPRGVTIGITDGTETEITSGLSEGETVVG